MMPAPPPVLHISVSKLGQQLVPMCPVHGSLHLDLPDQSTAKQMLSFLGTHSTDTGCPNIALQNLPAVQQLEPRISAAVERLNDVLRTALDAALRSQEQASMLLCLRAYAAIGNSAGAEQVGILFMFFGR